MAYGIVQTTQMQATNNDGLMRYAVSASNIENGSVFQLASMSADADKSQVFVATAPATSYLTNLWMAVEPEDVKVISGSNVYSGLDPDVRNFINRAGDVFAAAKPQVGDIITLSVDAVAGTKSTNEYVVATNGAFKLTWAAAPVSGTSLKLLKTTYMSVGSASLGGTGRVTAYQFEVVAI